LFSTVFRMYCPACLRIGTPSLLPVWREQSDVPEVPGTLLQTGDEGEDQDGYALCSAPSAFPPSNTVCTAYFRRI